MMFMVDNLEKLEREYANKKFVCRDCGEETPVETILEDFREAKRSDDLVFIPEELGDVSFKVCDGCSNLARHDLKDNSKSQTDATGQSESTNSGSTQPFSI